MSDSREVAWKTGQLGNFADVRARIGWRGLSSSEYTSDGPFLIAGQHIRSGAVSWGECDHISLKRYDESWEIALRVGDIILTKDGTIGRVARIDRIPGEATINGTMMLIRCHVELDYRYLSHYLRGRDFKALVDDRISGSSIPHIFQRDMVKLDLPLPPMREQRKIAEILDTADATIRTTEWNIAKLEQVRRGLLHDALIHGVETTGCLRDVPDRELQPSKLGLIPLGWRVATLGDLGLHGTSVLRTGPFGSSLKGEDWVDSGIPVITIGSLGEGVFSYEDLLFISDSKAASLDAYRVREGEIVFSRVADVGRSVVVRHEHDGWVMSSNLMKITLDFARVMPDYAQLALAHDPRVRRQLRSTVNSSGRDVVSGSIVKKLLIPLPPIGEQGQICAIASRCRDSLTVEANKLVKLRSLKQGLMDDLLTGRVRMGVSA